MSITDYYKLLGLDKKASEKEIKKAYKKLAKRYHPDFNQGDKRAEDKFKEISQAYQILSDPEKKKQYDMFGHDGFQGTAGFDGWNRGNNDNRQHRWSSGRNSVNFEEIFSEIFGGAGKRSMGSEAFSTASPFGFDDNLNCSSDRHIEAEVTISFDDAIKGGRQRFSLERDGLCQTCKGLGRHRGGKVKPCNACGGKGRKQVGNMGTNFSIICNDCKGEGNIFTEPCAACNGGGKTTGLDHLSVNIPPGVSDKGRLRIPGKGELGPDGRAGDLYVNIRVRSHKFFTRKGNDIHLDLPLTVSEAALGAKIKVPTLNGGKAALKIPAGTQNGAVLRMRKKGVADPKGRGVGCLYVHIKVRIPRPESDKTKKLMKELGKIETNPRISCFGG